MQNPGLKATEQTFEGRIVGTSSFACKSGRIVKNSFIRSEELQAIYPGQDAVVSHNECHWVESMDLQKGDAVHFQLWPFDGDRPKAMRVVRDGPTPTPAAPSSSTAPTVSSGVRAYAGINLWLLSNQPK